MDDGGEISMQVVIRMMRELTTTWFYQAVLIYDMEV